MENSTQSNTALHYLKGVTFFGKNICLFPSKYQTVSPSVQKSNESPQPLNFYADYTSSKFHRFRGNNIQAALKHIYFPSATLHVSNLGENVTEEHVKTIFNEEFWKEIITIKVFQFNQRKMALVQFKDAELATNALSLSNNLLINGRNVRLAFSNAQIQDSSDKGNSDEINNYEEDNLENSTDLGVNVQNSQE
eukprot:c17187_g1_i2.p1 GENE.c17187_g1_i2~~c17187_g1_i2.p1  ORF type:complete len:193 (-),score=58.20 c17187_g1_i2:71-649(-)